MMPDKSQLSDAIRIEQARQVLDNYPKSLGANAAMAACTVAVLAMARPEAWIAVWTAAFVLFQIYRLRTLGRLRRQTVAAPQAEAILRLACRYAAISGLIWAVLPLMTASESDRAAGAFVLFMVGSICAGALIRSTAYAALALSFAVPVLAGSVVAQMVAGRSEAAFIAAGLIYVTYMMAKAALSTEQEFCETQRLRIEATGLACSLEKANAEIRTANQQLRTLASRDTMTGLYNRSAFNEALGLLLDKARDSAGGLALLVVDLDNFKMINDTFGHAAGDRVIAEAATRVTLMAATSDLVARLGGDEFAMIVQTGDPGTAMGRADTVVAALSHPFTVDGRSIRLGCSVGVALYPRDADTAEDLFASADIALYEAKARGRQQSTAFNSLLRDRVEFRRLVELDLPGALERGELAVHFQKQVNIVTGTLMGFEALIRWEHPTLGHIPPPAIVAAAQTLHLPERLTAYVVEAAADFITALDEAGETEIVVAVNVSPVEFQLYSPAALILAILNRRGIPPRRMEVEITEEAILDRVATLPDLARLEAAGVRISVDDFGTGQSSLAHIADLKVQRLKIDRAFISGLAGNRRHQALVEAILGLARSLDMDVVAEGIETEADRAILERLGCRVGQGYSFGRPMPAAAILSDLAVRDLKYSSA